MDSEGNARHLRGVTDVLGLYFLGLTWQYTRGSALLGWVKDDAEFIAAQISANAATTLAEGRTNQDEPLRAPYAVGAREET